MPNSHTLSKTLLCLVLPGLLSGCAIAAGVIGEFAVGEVLGPSQQRYADPSETGKNHYEPVILTSEKNFIRIKYLSVGPNAEHEKVLQLISDHCHGAYIETSREELRGYDTVEAECAPEIKSLNRSSARVTPDPSFRIEAIVLSLHLQ